MKDIPRGLVTRATYILRDALAAIGVRVEQCEICGAKAGDVFHTGGAKLEIHHIIPAKKGGAADGWNLVVLCRSCHHLAEWMSEWVTPINHYYKSKGMQKRRRFIKDAKLIYAFGHKRMGKHEKPEPEEGET